MAGRMIEDKISLAMGYENRRGEWLLLATKIMDRLK